MPTKPARAKGKARRSTARFQQAPDGEGTQRLYYITSTLDSSKTPFPGWKLLVAQAATE